MGFVEEMKYLENKEDLAKIASTLGGIERVLSKISLVNIAMREYNIIQKEKFELALQTFLDNCDYSKTTVANRLNTYDFFKQHFSSINYKQAKEMLKEYSELVKV